VGCNARKTNNNNQCHKKAGDMNSARIFLCFSMHRFAAVGQEKARDLSQQKLESMKYLAAKRSEFGDVKCE
jgi:hypothetical protein